MQKGYQISFFTEQSRRKDGRPMGNWILETAKSLGIPIICLSQLNRGVENREIKVPRLSDLRESGAIEQDADCVVFQHVPSEYDESLPRGRNNMMVLTLAKNRHGPTGTVEVNYDSTCGRFWNRETTTQSSLF